MATVNNATSVSFQQVDVAGLDLETAMLAVQSNRANVLEDQLKDQMKAVQAKNEQINKLNMAMSKLDSLTKSFGSGDDTGKKLSEKGVTAFKEVNDAFKEAGLTDTVNGDTTKGQLEKAITNLKAQIDGLSNSQQMDMLRLQSLSNKRNEAFDLMSNWIKKMQDSRSSIIGNMR